MADFTSLPARGVWIEIRSYPEAGDWLGSLPARGVWIEITSAFTRTAAPASSLPARGVWIEISIRGR